MRAVGEDFAQVHPIHSLELEESAYEVGEAVKVFPLHQNLPCLLIGELAWMGEFGAMLCDVGEVRSLKKYQLGSVNSDYAWSVATSAKSP